MKMRLVPLLVTGLILQAIVGCALPLAAAKEADSTQTLPASPTFSQTLDGEQELNLPSKTGTPGPGSETQPNHVFIPAVRSAASPSTFCPAIQRGLSFLTERYNAELGLLNEAPVAAPHKYWLTNDNALAAVAFERLGQAEMGASITESISYYGTDTNGLIEVVWGVPVSFPPFLTNNDLVAEIGEDKIYQEVHNRGGKFEDWQDYANLGFLGALNYSNGGDEPQALLVYGATLDLFDGTGFADRALEEGRYETYKLALALYVGAVIQAPNSDRGQMLSTLLSMQDHNGGFITHYYDPQTPISGADANTETSALALLALQAGGCEP